VLTDAERSMLLEDLARTSHELSESYTHEGFARSPACGDEVTVRLTLAPTRVPTLETTLETTPEPDREPTLSLDSSDIQDVSFAVHGCTVSRAATTALAGLPPMSVPAFRAMYERYSAAVNGVGVIDGAGEGDLEPFAGIGRFPLRAQCATLAWRALAAAIDGPARHEAQQAPAL
jgi:nitrogen fixation protein NifU and related proteins